MRCIDAALQNANLLVALADGAWRRRCRGWDGFGRAGRVPVARRLHAVVEAREKVTARVVDLYHRPAW